MIAPDDRPPDSGAVGAGEYDASTSVGLGAEASGLRRLLLPVEESSVPLFAPGEIVGDKYLIESVLGEGGLGIIVAATHLHLDQKVAIKYLRGGAPRERAITDRFLREARLAAQIRSEHVVRVYDVGTVEDGTPYMVMEHLEGRDLRKVLAERGRVSLAQAVDWVLQACEALADAHAQGIVHRDFKPENMFLAELASGREVLKLLDFGISKRAERYASPSRTNVVTKAGQWLGTPLYMSPEQLEGNPDVDGRTDMWAIGVVLYELCTGVVPFTGESLPALCTSVLTKTPVPVTKLRPELPPELDLVILRCVAKMRDDRYANVAELALELAPFASAAGQERVQEIVQTTLHAGEPVRSPRFRSTPPGSAASGPASAPPSIGPARKRTTTRALAVAAMACIFGFGLAVRALGPPLAGPTVAVVRAAVFTVPAAVLGAPASLGERDSPTARQDGGFSVR